MNSIQFIKAQDDDFKFVREIRIAVFTNEQGADAADEFDCFDDVADFLLLYDKGKPVATARLVITEKGYKIGRIAVLKEYRGNGYGAVIVRRVTEKAFNKGAETVYVDAQSYAVPFYEKIGFRIISEEIIDRGLPHIPMRIERKNYYVR